MPQIRTRFPWDTHIYPKIQEFLKENPKGNLKEFLTWAGPVYRCRYYKVKPPDFQFPNTSRRGRSPATEGRLYPSQTAAYKHFNRFYGFTSDKLREYFIELGLSEDFNLPDWDANQRKYIGQMKQLYYEKTGKRLERAYPPTLEDNQEKPKYVELFTEEKEEEKPQEQEQKPKEKLTKREEEKLTKREALLELAKLIAES